MEVHSTSLEGDIDTHKLESPGNEFDLQHQENALNTYPIGSTPSENKSKATMNDSTPTKHRSFGEELDSNFFVDPLNTSLLSMESKDPVFESTPFDDQNSFVGSDSHADSSSVASRRAWLDEFGKSQKKGSAVPGDREVERPTQRKVRRSMSTLPPTPLPKTAASALVKRMMEPGSTSTKKDLHRRASATPVRIKPRVDSREVQATDSGYASVAKLSAWLADDPTSTKKMTHLRRGANVISKSRVFDKGLANVIVEQNCIRRGSVKEKRQSIDADFSRVDDDCSVSSVGWLEEQKLEQAPVKQASSSISVTDKKKWLTGAFKKADENVAMKAKTDIASNNDTRDATTSRAKELWRSRSSHHPPPVPRDPRSFKVEPRGGSELSKLPDRRSFKAEPRGGSELSNQLRQLPPASPQRPPVDEDTASVDFQAARRLLVARSKKNGNDVEVINKVYLRKTKFERLEKEARRMSAPQGLLRASWDAEDSGYVKKYVPDVAPKKSFDDLP